MEPLYLDTYTVSLFGHRIISEPIEMEKALDEIVRELIRSKKCVEFLVGRNGDFDIMAASVIRRAKRDMDYGNTFLVLVLPYSNAVSQKKIKEYESYYDEVEVCEESAAAHFKAAFKIRNRHMVERSNLTVCCVQHNSGGAYEALRYAESTGIKVINIAAKQTFQP